MSHYIPVFFFPVGDDEVPSSLDNWHSAEELFSHKYENREESQMREVSSRNWWFQDTLHLICSGLKIEGLDFILKEIVCLDLDQLQQAKAGLDEVLDKISLNIPDLGPEIEEINTIKYLRRSFRKGKYKRYTRRQMRKQFEEAEPKFKVNNFTDIDYQSKVDFYSFIKSLQSCVEECLSSGKKMLYVQPQP